MTKCALRRLRGFKMELKVLGEQIDDAMDDFVEEDEEQ